MRLRLDDVLSPGASFHVGRITLRPTERPPQHTHDFAEVFWVDAGSGTHIVNGARHLLTMGDLVFVRPQDTHTFRAGDDFAMVNVAFGVPTLDFLKRRYFEESEWPWRDGRFPAVHALDPVRHERLRVLLPLLAAGAPDRLALERFLLELLHDNVLASRGGDSLPGWLRDALDRLTADPVALEEGVPALARLARRSPEHINRVMRTGTGRTTTETINSIRLSRAATALRMTDVPITQVAAECGFGNLSHFYRLFHHRFATTPRRYRLAHRALVRGHHR